jgi:hypothetical protein
MSRSLKQFYFIIAHSYNEIRSWFLKRKTKPCVILHSTHLWLIVERNVLNVQETVGCITKSRFYVLNFNLIYFNSIGQCRYLILNELITNYNLIGKSCSFN